MPPTPRSGRGGGAAEPQGNRVGEFRPRSDGGAREPGSEKRPAPRTSRLPDPRPGARLGGRPFRRGPADSRSPGRGRAPARRPRESPGNETSSTAPLTTPLLGALRRSSSGRGSGSVTGTGSPERPFPRRTGGRPRRHREKRDEKTRRGRNFPRRPAGGRPRSRVFSARSGQRSRSGVPLACHARTPGTPLRPGGSAPAGNRVSGAGLPLREAPSARQTSAAPVRQGGRAPRSRSGTPAPTRPACGSAPAGVLRRRRKPRPRPDDLRLHGAAPAAAGPRRRPDPPPRSLPSASLVGAGSPPPSSSNPPDRQGSSPKPDSDADARGPGFRRRPERGRPLRPPPVGVPESPPDSTPDSPDDRTSTSGPRRADLVAGTRLRREGRPRGRDGERAARPPTRPPHSAPRRFPRQLRSAATLDLEPGRTGGVPARARATKKSPGARGPGARERVRPKQSGRSGQDAVGRCGAGFLLSWTGR